MSSEEKSVKLKMSISELAEFLRGLAGQLEGEETGTDLSGIRISDFSKLKLSMKRKDDFVKVKYKVKHEEAEEEDDEEDEDEEDEKSAGSEKEKYKSLKERMKESYKTIKESMEADTLPEESVANSFIEDSRLMTTFPDKGDEYYDLYNTAVAGFEKALMEKNFLNVEIALKEIERIKTDCHEKHK